MTVDEVLEHFKGADALLQGHFILSSGRHSALYLQKQRVMMFPWRAEALCRALADKVTAAGFTDISAIVSPAVGAITVGYEMARQMNLPAMFVERENGKFELRRGFALSPGERVLMVEDIVTTGLSSREAISAIEDAGGKVVAAACLIDRSNGAANVGRPLVALARLDIPSFAPDELPPELAALPAVKPGSRHLSKV